MNRFVVSLDVFQLVPIPQVTLIVVCLRCQRRVFAAALGSHLTALSDAARGHVKECP